MDDRFLLTVPELASATGGEIVPTGDVGIAGFSSVSIDSRSVLSGGLFVALAGLRSDGHEYLEQAFDSGARVALVSATRMDADGARLRGLAGKAGANLVVVRDTLRAMQDAAGRYLDRFPSLLRIGITGSSGKTTTKELAAAMISPERRVVMNVGNLNSETGLPLSAFQVRAEHEVGIFEMGMNRRAEMGELARVLRPRIALVTNVGTAHIGILGSVGAIAEEKKDIFSMFAGSETALIPEDDPSSDFLAADVRGIVKRYGPRSLTAFGGARSLDLDGTEIVWDGVAVTLAIPGAHNLMNALAAAAIATEAGVSAAAIRTGLASARPLFGRAEILKGPVTVVRDCYNANPEATEAAIAFCDSVEWKGRRIYVVGSMLELGEAAEREHERIGEALARCKADDVVLFGPETEAAARVLREGGTATGAVLFRTDDIDDLSRIVSARAREGDLVLLKGSRGMALERLTEILIPGEKGGA
ncbi:MAG: UDP-N-acetylmuramoyl-tripeptide--D-alanyl-D-alanine ligase [Treponema sp. GWB1_62_6]|nr:MAG: UDP-N-acetylmuramoyl-tripeptide--D-alanyl-D-alanine ligase [Treponema sp. GWB1_62_6]OHE63932.1 MAG: UDP-N-acetylmuramoyl-tripeptide--D-alanyl-D-alanine ligase [Treponema sp. GWC1_61_84]HCM25254.1 UDP-N-acetylmuramoyl-tripeptide--D-alanyl-D-alanine ligase [Treponema sp.]